MASTLPPVKNAAFTFYVALVSQADTDIFKTSATLAAGDVKVSKDGGAFNNVATLPTEIGTSGVLSCPLSADEMNADVVVVKFSDAAGAEWQDALVSIYTAGQTLDTTDSVADTISGIVGHMDYGNAKLVRATTPANKLAIAAGGEASANVTKRAGVDVAAADANGNDPVVLANTAHGGAAASLSLRNLNITDNSFGGQAVTIEANGTGGKGIGITAAFKGMTVSGVSADIEADITGSVDSVTAGVVLANTAHGGADATMILGRLIMVNNTPYTRVIEISNSEIGGVGVYINANQDIVGSIVGDIEGLAVGAQQDVRDAMTLAPTAGDPAAGSVDKHLDDLETSTAAIKLVTDTLDVSAVTQVAASSAGHLTITAGLTFDEGVTGLTIPADWVAAIWTLKHSAGQADSAAVIQLRTTNPADGEDGLQRLNGVAVASPITAADGALTVTQATGQIDIWLSDELTLLLAKVTGLGWDIKFIDANDDSTGRRGTADVVLTETQAVV